MCSLCFYIPFDLITGIHFTSGYCSHFAVIRKLPDIPWTPPLLMSGPSARTHRYWLLILVVFTVGNYSIFSGCHVKRDIQSSKVSSTVQTEPFGRLSWMNSTAPETSIVLHKMAGEFPQTHAQLCCSTRPQVGRYSRTCTSMTRQYIS